MPPVPAVPGFDYSTPPAKNSWSRKYVKSAFPQSQEETLSRLFNRASELVQEQNLYAKAFVGQQHSKKLLEQKREQAANLLQSEFRNAIDIQGHPTFAGRLCYGVLIYQSGSGATIKLPAATTSSFTSPKSPALPSAFQPAAAPSLEDFEFNCFPPRLGINPQSCKLRAEQLFVGVSGASLQLGDFRVGPLRTRLEARNILSDPDHQCLMYQTSDGIFELTDADDLRNAVRDARRSSRNYLRISCKTQDDIGWLTSLLLRCELLRDGRRC